MGTLIIKPHYIHEGIYKRVRTTRGRVLFPSVRANTIPKPQPKRYRQAGFSKATLLRFAKDDHDPFRDDNTIAYLGIYGKAITDTDVITILEAAGVVWQREIASNVSEC